MTPYYAKIKSSKSKSAHIFWIGWLIKMRKVCVCVCETASYLIYDHYVMYLLTFCMAFAAAIDSMTKVVVR